MPEGVARKTTSGQSLACKQDTQGEAEIVTTRHRLIERVFCDIRQVLAGQTD